MRLSVVSLLTVVALAAGGCSRTTEEPASGPAGRTPATTPTTGTAGSTRVPGTSGTTRTTRRPTGTTTPADVGTIDWSSCGKAECGTLTVPLDHDDPHGRTIDLAVVRRPATDPDRRIGSLFVNPGGPGASGVDFLRLSPPSKALNERFDLVSWDPRGVGKSNPVPCGEDEDAYRQLDWSPDDAAEQSALDDAARTIADRCGTADLDLLRHLGTDDVARDLDRLRAAVGDDKLTYLGYSYGTFIGERYAELFPDHVRAMVLDGVVDPTEDLPTMLRGQTKALETLVTKLFEQCDASASCPVQDAAATYDRVAAKVEQSPLKGSNGQVVLGPTTLAFATVASSYEESLQPMFLRGLAAADKGDGSLLRTLAQTYWSAGDYPAYLGVLCADEPHPDGADAYARFAGELAALSPRFGAAIANEVLPCAFWPVPAKADGANAVRAEGAPPILVVGNTGDVATPYESARRVAGQLASGVLLTYDGEGHTSYGKSPCVDEAVDAYLVDLQVPAVGARCH